MAKKPRGAPKGNKNALKHGYYSELLTPAEVARLNGIADVDLDDEIALLRTLVHRLAREINLSDMETALKTAATVAQIVQVINTTQRTKILGRGNSEIAQTITEAIMSLDPYKSL